jgi:hypothetical protein
MVRELNGQFTGISGSSCMSSGAALLIHGPGHHNVR